MKRPSAERAPTESRRGAMCVRRFDDSLNSAIHNTLSRFATVFIDARAKGSAVGSCFDNQLCKGQHKTTLALVLKESGSPEGSRRTPGAHPRPPRDGAARKEFRPPVVVRPRSRQRAREGVPPTTGTDLPSRGGRPRAHARARTVMILPQVHLRKPCYDFYFIDPRQIKGLSRNGPRVAPRSRTGPTFSWTRTLCSSDGRCVQRAGT